jgi:hypothetical protein
MDPVFLAVPVELLDSRIDAVSVTLTKGVLETTIDDVCVIEGPIDLLRRELRVSGEEAVYEREESIDGVDAAVLELEADVERVPFTLTVRDTVEVGERLIRSEALEVGVFTEVAVAKLVPEYVIVVLNERLDTAEGEGRRVELKVRRLDGEAEDERVTLLEEERVAEAEEERVELAERVIVALALDVRVSLEDPVELLVDVSERVPLEEPLKLDVAEELGEPLELAVKEGVNTPDLEDILDAVADFEPVDVRDDVDDPVEVLLVVEVLEAKAELVDVRDVVDERVALILRMEVSVPTDDGEATIEGLGLKLVLALNVEVLVDVADGVGRIPDSPNSLGGSRPFTRAARLNTKNRSSRILYLYHTLALALLVCQRNKLSVHPSSQEFSWLTSCLAFFKDHSVFSYPDGDIVHHFLPDFTGICW